MERCRQAANARFNPPQLQQQQQQRQLVQGYATSGEDNRVEEEEEEEVDTPIIVETKRTKKVKVVAQADKKCS